MNATLLRASAMALALTLASAATSWAQGNPCGLLTDAEVLQHIARGDKRFPESPEVTQVSGGAVCDYSSGQIGLWNGMPDLERFLKAWKADKEKRHPVSGVGDNAWIMFPVPENKYKDRPAYLVARVGSKVVTVALHAHDGAADGPMGAACRAVARLKPDEREDCKKILADKSETQESLQPNVIELAKLVVARVRAGKS